MASGGGLDDQEAKIRSFATARGVELVGIEVDGGVSGTSTDGRDALARALELVHSGQADGIVVTKIDRLARSVADFSRLAADAKREGWTLAVSEIGLDLSTSNGRLVAGIMANVAEWEAEVIAERTADAMQAKIQTGTRYGRKSKVPAVVVDRIVAERAAGRGLVAIGEGLMADGILTSTGRPVWHASTVKQVLTTAELDAYAAARRA
ncbi:Site-specific DNA recombinase [Klenkia marina]|uniref:Site-specific DNA recombinase n=1 Tax=Klenkia marina TaxID=1960309 RepID=A0A1G4Y6D0_9ACTN|nr:Site-specific DNA recombinase [Klenkia marina]